MSSYKLNQADADTIRKHLLSCDFNPPLSSYITNIDDYVAKVMTNGTRIECWVEAELVGIAIFYANNYDTKEAFITIVCVLPEYRGKGIASELLSRTFHYCKERQFDTICLEVYKENQGAKSLYEKLGFSSIHTTDGKIRMVRKLDDA